MKPKENELKVKSKISVSNLKESVATQFKRKTLNIGSVTPIAIGISDNPSLGFGDYLGERNQSIVNESSKRNFSLNSAS